MSEGKKGLPIWAWFGIGCAGLLVILMVVVVVGGIFVTRAVKDVAADFEKNPEIATARMIVKLNPDIEEVEIDEDAGTITVRNKKTGEIFIADVDELKDGRFTITDEDGEAVVTATGSEDENSFKITAGGQTMEFGGGDAGNIPSWIPVITGARVEPIMSMVSDGLSHGSIKIVTDKDSKVVLDFYKKEMETAGFTLQTSSFSGGDESIDVLTGQIEDPKKSLIVNVSVGSDGDVNIALTYSEGEGE